MRLFIKSILFTLFFTFISFADNEAVQTTEAVLETPCYECEESTMETTESENNEFPQESSGIQITGLHFITSKVDEFEGEISVDVINYSTSEKNTYVLSKDNGYTLDVEYKTKDFQVIPSISKQYNYDYYSNAIISEPCPKGIIEVNIVIDYKLIDTEQEDGAFDTDENYNAYTSNLDTVEEEFGLSENTRPKTVNEAVEKQIKEYESKITEETDASINSADDYMENVNSLFLIICGVVFLVVVILGIYIITCIRKNKDDD